MFDKALKAAKMVKKASDATNVTRRGFLKGIGSLALSSALPGGAKMAEPLVKIATKDATRKAPPWIKAMVASLDNIEKPKKSLNRINTNQKLIKKTTDEFKTTKEFEITTADGNKDYVIYRNYKNGDKHIEFDIRDDYHNNQHIYIDGKNGTTEIVDENYYMTSPDDFAKDDPIIYDVTTPTQMQELERKLGVMRGDVDGRMLDFASTPEDGDYSYLFERYIDTYSPSGNIFNTRQSADIAEANRQKDLQLKRRKAEDEEIDFENQFRGGTLHGYNIGGIVSKLKTVGSLTKGLEAAKPLGPISKGQTKLPPPEKPFSALDEAGLPVKDFKTADEAQEFTKGQPGMSTGLAQSEEVRLPAMFWKSREEIAEANQNIMTGSQWLNYLKKRGVGDTELKDTSLGFHLSMNAGKKINKTDLLDEYEEFAPQIQAKILGWRDSKRLVKDTAGFVQDTLRNPPVYMDIGSRKILRNVYQTMTKMDLQNPTGPQMVRLKEIINKGFKDEFGIDEIIGKGLDPSKQLPFMAKKTALVFDDLLNQKGIQYNAQGKPMHAGDQTLSGGRNYQEVLFSYKPGKYRESEPIYKQGHDFGGQRPDNMFVWVRFSDRTDEYGRKLLFVEEIQSDMHAGARTKGSYDTGYAPRSDSFDPDTQKMTGIQKSLADLQKKIDDKGGVNLGNLRAQQQKLIDQSKQLKPGGKKYKSRSEIPEGPFADSKDHGRFIMQYLLRAAKESGDYDGIAIASADIKGKEKTGFYKNIMIPQMKKISKKTGAKYDETVIVDAKGNPRDSIPVLLLKDKKGIIQSTSKMDQGISAYKDGGLVRSSFQPIVSSLT
jgi:hypothetical protein